MSSEGDSSLEYCLWGCVVLDWHCAFLDQRDLTQEEDLLPWAHFPEREISSSLHLPDPSGLLLENILFINRLLALSHS